MSMKVKVGIGALALGLIMWLPVFLITGNWLWTVAGAWSILVGTVILCREFVQSESKREKEAEKEEEELLRIDREWHKRGS